MGVIADFGAQWRVKHVTNFKGFETYDEARKFARTHGGIICHAEHRKKDNRDYHQMAVAWGGLNSDKYRYSVQWNGSRA
jgi:hypothetical protein